MAWSASANRYLIGEQKDVVVKVAVEVVAVVVVVLIDNDERLVSHQLGALVELAKGVS